MACVYPVRCGPHLAVEQLVDEWSLRCRALGLWLRPVLISSRGVAVGHLDDPRRPALWALCMHFRTWGPFVLLLVISHLAGSPRRRRLRPSPLKAVGPVHPSFTYDFVSLADRA